MWWTVRKWPFAKRVNKEMWNFKRTKEMKQAKKKYVAPCMDVARFDAELPLALSETSIKMSKDEANPDLQVYANRNGWDLWGE